MIWILVVIVAAFPDMRPIEVGRYDTGKACQAAAAQLDQSTRVVLKLSCDRREV